MRRNPGEKGTEKINIIIWQEKEIGNFSKGERFLPPFSVALLYFFRLNLLKTSPLLLSVMHFFSAMAPGLKQTALCHLFQLSCTSPLKPYQRISIETCSLSVPVFFCNTFLFYYISIGRNKSMFVIHQYGFRCQLM